MSDLRVAELHNDAVGEGQILTHNPTDGNGQQKFGFRDEASKGIGPSDLESFKKF